MVGAFDIYDPQYGDLQLDSLAPTDQPGNEVEQVGIYLADHIEVGPVAVSAGLRHDWAENRELAVTGADTVSDEEATTGRLGLMYRFENGISPYVSYSEAFSMNLGTDGTANQSTLKPTTGEQEEAGLSICRQINRWRSAPPTLILLRKIASTMAPPQAA